MTEIVNVWSGPIQGGFAVFCILLLGVVVWLVKQLMVAYRDNQRVISGNTSAIESVNHIASDTKHLMSDIRDQLLSRPCMLVSRQPEGSHEQG